MNTTSKSDEQAWFALQPHELYYLRMKVWEALPDVTEEQIEDALTFCKRHLSRSEGLVKLRQSVIDHLGRLQK